MNKMYKSTIYQSNVVGAARLGRNESWMSVTGIDTKSLLGELTRCGQIEATANYFGALQNGVCIDVGGHRQNPTTRQNIADANEVREANGTCQFDGAHVRKFRSASGHASNDTRTQCICKQNNNYPMLSTFVPNSPKYHHLITLQIQLLLSRADQRHQKTRTQNRSHPHVASDRQCMIWTFGLYTK